MVRSLSILAIAIVAVCTSATFVKAAILFSGNLTDTSQISSATNSLYFANGQADVVGANLSHAITVAGGSNVQGISFDNVDLDPNGSPYALSANGGGYALTAAGIAFTARERTQSLNATGPNDTVLEALTNNTYFVTGSETVTMTVSGLTADKNHLVQVIGGDSGTGWTGNFHVSANGNVVGDWTTVTDENISTASLFTFDTTSNAFGTLTLSFNHFGGSFAGISGFILSEALAAPVPEPSSLFLLGLGSIGLMMRRKRIRHAHAAIS